MPAVYTDPHRRYRDLCLPRTGEIRFQVVVGETDLQVTASPLPGAFAPEEADADTVSRAFAAAMSKEVTRLRGEIAAWSVLHPAFRHSLVPVPLAGQAPESVCRMTRAAEIAGVGPFAAVAGTIAQLLVEHFAEQSPDLIVENGGDIAMCSQKERVVGVLSDPESGTVIGLRIPERSGPQSLCASSATIGHSLSFGQGDLALIRSPDAALADALATALCNRLQSATEVQPVLELARTFVPQGLTGVFLQCGGAIGIWGDMELVPLV